MRRWSISRIDFTCLCTLNNSWHFYMLQCPDGDVRRVSLWYNSTRVTVVESVSATDESLIALFDFINVRRSRPFFLFRFLFSDWTYVNTGYGLFFLPLSLTSRFPLLSLQDIYRVSPLLHMYVTSLSITMIIVLRDCSWLTIVAQKTHLYIRITRTHITLWHNTRAVCSAIWMYILT